MARRIFTATSIALTLTLIAAGCGGSETPSASEVTTTALADDTTTTASIAPEEPTTTLAPTTIAEPAGTPIPVIDATDTPALIEAWGDGTAPTLELAQDIIGFPLDLAPASDGGAYSLSVEMEGSDTESDWEWDWTYEAIAADPIGDIDIALDNNGAGSVALRDHYEPILNVLGWSYSNSTGSDPSSGAGGAQSMNHVFQNDAGSLRLGDIDATTNPLFVWADEDIDFRDGPDVAGYRIDVSLDSPANFIPVPFVDALLRETPTVPGARLVDVSLRSRDRPESSFDAEFGLRYFELEFIFDLPVDAVDAARDVYSTGLAGTVFRLGEESFFDPGFLEVTEPRIDGENWTQQVVLLDRYSGEIAVETHPESGDVQSAVRIRLEPNRVVLEDLPD